MKVLENRFPLFFSIDVEEWWGVESFKKFFKNKSIPKNDRLTENIKFIIELFNKNGIICHFFVLGRIAEKYPQAIKMMADNGHGIGTHGFSHELVYKQTPQTFEYDLKKSIHILEEASAKKITSYRAPSYSITKKSIWALNILADNGIEYDSSIVPTSNSRFGIKNSLRRPYAIKLKKGKLIKELPPNTIDFKLFSLPLGSGFAFRLFPTFIIKNRFQINYQKNIFIPQVILHNWEFDVNQPRLNVGFKSGLIHYFNINKVQKRLLNILKNTEIITLDNIDFNVNIELTSLT